VDCIGQVDGTAVLDQCNQCSGGTSGHPYNEDMDCMGVCFGPFVIVHQLSPHQSTEDNTTYCLCDLNDLLCSVYELASGPINITSTVDSLSVYEWPAVGLASLGLVLGAFVYLFSLGYCRFRRRR